MGVGEKAIDPRMVIATLLVTVEKENLETTNYLSLGVNKLCNLHTLECYAAIQKE